MPKSCHCAPSPKTLNLELSAQLQQQYMTKNMSSHKGLSNIMCNTQLHFTLELCTNIILITWIAQVHVPLSYLGLLLEIQGSYGKAFTEIILPKASTWSDSIQLCLLRPCGVRTCATKHISIPFVLSKESLPIGLSTIPNIERQSFCNHSNKTIPGAHHNRATMPIH